jgi:hypothetical protein
MLSQLEIGDGTEGQREGRYLYAKYNKRGLNRLQFAVTENAKIKAPTSMANERFAMR